MAGQGRKTAVFTERAAKKHPFAERTDDKTDFRRLRRRKRECVAGHKTTQTGESRTAASVRNEKTAPYESTGRKVRHRCRKRLLQERKIRVIVRVAFPIHGPHGSPRLFRQTRNTRMPQAGEARNRQVMRVFVSPRFLRIPVCSPRMRGIVPLCFRAGDSQKTADRDSVQASGTSLPSFRRSARISDSDKFDRLCYPPGPSSLSRQRHSPRRRDISFFAFVRCFRRPVPQKPQGGRQPEPGHIRTPPPVSPRSGGFFRQIEPNEVPSQP